MDGGALVVRCLRQWVAKMIRESGSVKECWREREKEHHLTPPSHFICVCSFSRQKLLPTGVSSNTTSSSSSSNSTQRGNISSCRIRFLEIATFICTVVENVPRTLFTGPDSHSVSKRKYYLLSCYALKPRIGSRIASTEGYRKFMRALWLVWVYCTPRSTAIFAALAKSECKLPESILFSRCSTFFVCSHRVLTELACETASRALG